MGSSGKSLEERVHELEIWRDQQITRDTVTVTRFEDEFGAVHSRLDDLDAGMAGIRASIGDLDGRSVASRLISMSVDIGNLATSQELLSCRMSTVESDIGTMKLDIGGMKLDIDGLKSDVGGMKSDIAQILGILRKPNGSR
ncbi:hypothetical protein F3087_29565 [Nocardia colli]|uniref:Uncharacterized protein n=1 Tax=Nocardia colli TaxID=2545717 RepID=A0A5N0E7S9_9NOCA|nr:hypothetical protein [Nocardia colli]KAA8885003.1 hypothetical protein F3087_29565 [Nocardia colli]